MLKIIIGMMYIKRSNLSQEEVLKVLKIDKKEKEKIKKMYKDNPVLQFLTQTIFEDEIKKYQQLLKQKELEKEIEKEREIIEILLKLKVREKIDNIILKIQKIEDLSKLNKIRKILELNLDKNEYLNHINELI